MDCYSKELSEVVAQLSTTSNGLSNEEAAKRLEENGKNELTQGKKKSLFARFIAQFKDVMIVVLIAAAIISAVIAIIEAKYGDLIDSAIIMLIVIVNAVIGVAQESKAEAALDALKKMNKPFSKVVRNGELITIKSEELVVGDIVSLEAGDIVPADLRLISSSSLKIEEAALTGESVPAEKDYLKIIEENAPLGDRSNMAYSSGIISYGRGRGVVTSTGMNTEVGKIAKMLSEGEVQSTPLQRQLAKTAKVLSVIVLAIALVIFAASIIRKTPLIESFMTAVAIAVAAIPEGLPAVVTIVLALGVQRMSKRNAIIRNLPAVETLGCCEIICSDKTGTLTLNQMTVKELFTVSGGSIKEENYDEYFDRALLTRTMTLCNDSQETGEILLGDPTETSLVYFARNKGTVYSDLKKQWQRIEEIPFDSTRKLMTTLNQNGEEVVAHIKGATDLMLNKCKFIMDNGVVRKITNDDLEKIKLANATMAKQALRVLGVAVKYENLTNIKELEQDMVFVGLVGMIDPPRPEVKEAVRVCVKAGMRPIMITGDHIETASAIAKEIGILREGDKVMLGAEIDKLSHEEFSKIILEYSVFARVSPENKVRIVKAYRSDGFVVAMTGDGVNDAPSIKEADIGIGMGITGTDVSKGAADMILTDDNFATIIGAVEEGRKIFTNIKKALQFLLSANIAEVLCLFIATIFLGTKFLTPVMILWVNLVTDSLPALSLGMKDADDDVMNFPPRKSKASLFQGKMGKDILVQGIMQTILVMVSFSIGNYLLDDGLNNHNVAMTMAFVSLCLIQLFHSYNMKAQGSTIFTKNLFKNKWLNISFIIGVLLILVVTLIPVFQNIFDTAPLSWYEWLISIGSAILIVPMVEIQKIIDKLLNKKIKQKPAKKAI